MGELTYCVCECGLLYPALPLTVDNVFEAVKTVRMSWRVLARWLMGWYDSTSEHRKKLDAIERQNVFDKARLKALVAAFLLGEGEHQPSWRMLIHRLYKAGEIHIAERIKTNAEPHQGEWIWRGGDDLGHTYSMYLSIL
jgi:hypothetical protein